MYIRLSCDAECLLEIGQHPEEAEGSEQSAYRQIFRLRAVHLMAFFILIYVGYAAYQVLTTPSY